MRWRVKFLVPATRSAGEATFEGENELALGAQLAHDGRVLLSARRMLDLSDVLPRISQRFPVALFCEELKALLDAGLNLVEALDALRSNEMSSISREVYARLVARVQEGKRFSAALEAESVFPNVLVSAVRGSEYTSGIGDALGRYLDYHRRLDDLRSRVINAAIYPAIVLGLGVAIVLLLLGYVVPRFASIYMEHATTVGIGTRAILSVGQVIAQYGWFCAIAFAVALYWFVRTLMRAASGTMSFDFLQRVRWLRTPFRNLESARIFETVAILVRGGFPLSYAVDVARDICLTHQSRTALSQVRRYIEEGGTLHSALRIFQIGDEVAVRLAAAGGDSGDLAGALQHAAEHYGRRFARAVERLARVAEPLLLIVVGTVIGGIVLLMYTPIFDLATSVGR